MIYGTIIGLKADNTELDILKGDGGTVSVNLTPKTIILRKQPNGRTSEMAATDIAVGDAIYGHLDGASNRLTILTVTPGQKKIALSEVDSIDAQLHDLALSKIAGDKHLPYEQAFRVVAAERLDLIRRKRLAFERRLR